MGEKERLGPGIERTVGSVFPDDYLGWVERGSPYVDDHEYLKSLGVDGWKDLYADPDRSFGLISGAMLEQEYAIYNPGDEMRSETKILFMIAEDLKRATNFNGTPARKKEMKWAKASEHDELIAILSNFIERFPGVSASRVYSELADFYWNLINLTYTDAPSSEVYLGMVDQLAGVVGLSKGQVGLLVIAKYQARLYELGGKNDHEIEDAQIKRLMLGNWKGGGDGGLPELNEKVATRIFSTVQTVIRPKLAARLSQLKSDHDYVVMTGLYLREDVGVGFVDGDGV